MIKLLLYLHAKETCNWRLVVRRKGHQCAVSEGHTATARATAGSEVGGQNYMHSICHCLLREAWCLSGISVAQVVSLAASMNISGLGCQRPLHRSPSGWHYCLHTQQDPHKPSLAKPQPHVAQLRSYVLRLPFTHPTGPSTATPWQLFIKLCNCSPHRVNAIRFLRWVSRSCAGILAADTFFCTAGGPRSWQRRAP